MNTSGLFAKLTFQTFQNLNLFLKWTVVGLQTVQQSQKVYNVWLGPTVSILTFFLLNPNIFSLDNSVDPDQLASALAYKLNANLSKVVGEICQSGLGNSPLPAF